MNPPKQHKKVNKMIETIFDKIHKEERPVACMNCEESYCCINKKQIVITEIEREIISKFVTDKHRDNARTSIGQKRLTGLYSCPFLEDGKCSIYKVRPITCSSYNVVSPSEGCKNPEQSAAIISPEIVFPYLPKDYIEAMAKSREMDILDLFR